MSVVMSVGENVGMSVGKSVNKGVAMSVGENVGKSVGKRGSFCPHFSRSSLSISGAILSKDHSNAVKLLVQILVIVGIKDGSV